MSSPLGTPFLFGIHGPKALKGSCVTLHLNVQCVVYLEVLVIPEHLDNILFFHYSKIVFEYEFLAIFAGKTQKYSFK